MDFSDSDFTASVFSNCDLQGAIFQNTVLQKCDFKSATNFNIHPTENQISKAIFASDNLNGLLQSFNIKIE